VIHTARRLGMKAVAVYSDADAELPYVSDASEAVYIGPSAPAQSYLNIDAILQAAERTGAASVHPGYGFLAESPVLARSGRDRADGRQDPRP
jgi:acetyl-CoA carboxylase, biotin carboxylase subunit